ncbi:MAG: Hydroxymethylpyrimidine/phosphomethylpyrimidine kinase [Sphingomonas bacterium]|nr:Hydroxymethylpyrimidine/phosphomethylpyrimidine kinase [Sphingomonas bacterium]
MGNSASLIPTPRILIIAGSDSGGGAGIQADIKTVTMLGGHAMTAVTAITAQNTLGVQAVMPVPADMVVAQIRSCIDDIGVDAIKIGMLGTAETARAVADTLVAVGVPIVFDPVMIATSGSILADVDTIAAFERLMRIAAVVTPNVPELAVLTGSEVSSEGEARAAGRTLAANLKVPVLAKGGHLAPDRTGQVSLPEESRTTDLLADNLVLPDGSDIVWTYSRIDTPHTHGTGCTLASAIATGLGAGLDLPAAVGRAIGFVRASLERAPGLGHGHGPMGQQFVTEFRTFDGR